MWRNKSIDWKIISESRHIVEKKMEFLEMEFGLFLSLNLDYTAAWFTYSIHGNPISSPHPTTAGMSLVGNWAGH